MEESDVADVNLLRRVADGDQRALAILFDRHGPAVTRYAWVISTNRMDVEEIVQDTFVTMWRKAPDITVPDRSLLPWLLVTCRNFERNAARKAARNQADELDAASPDAAALMRVHHDAETARDELRWVLDEIERLGPTDRRVCELCLIEGVPYVDAAKLLNLSVDAVKQRVSRNRVKLKKAVTLDEI